MRAYLHGLGVRSTAVRRCAILFVPAVWAMARSDYPPYGSTSQPGIWVFTYSMGASSPVAIDAPFTLAIYGS
jgi:hypothetical protein